MAHLNQLPLLLLGPDPAGYVVNGQDYDFDHWFSADQTRENVYGQEDCDIGKCRPAPHLLGLLARAGTRSVKTVSERIQAGEGGRQVLIPDGWSRGRNPSHTTQIVCEYRCRLFCLFAALTNTGGYLASNTLYSCPYGSLYPTRALQYLLASSTCRRQSPCIFWGKDVRMNPWSIIRAKLWGACIREERLGWGRE